MKAKKLYQKINNYIPIWSIVIYFFAFVSILVYLFCTKSTEFADNINNFTSPFRAFLSVLTSLFPFSIFELFVFFFFIILLILIFKYASRGNKQTHRFVHSILMIFLCYFISFVWTVGCGYYITPIERKMNLNIENITKTNVYDALVDITNEINMLTPSISYDEKGASIMPYTIKDMSLKICDAYRAKNAESKLSYNTRVKPLLFSKLLSLIRVSGIYIPLTGEANINMDYSDFMIASTASHEMAHQRGISRENEACFVGFYVLSSSNDDYLKYSAYLDAYGRLLPVLKKEDKNLYNRIVSLINKKAIKDYNLQVNRTINNSSETVAGSSDKINDSYLQVNGISEGIKNYEKANLLIVSYLNTH